MSASQVSGVPAEGPGSPPGFEALLAELSSTFINLPPDEVDREIEDALRCVCEHVGLDLAVLWQWSDSDPDVIRPTHAYPALASMVLREPMAQRLYPWTVRQMLAGREIALASVEELPNEATADRDSARRVGIKSNLTLPLLMGGALPVGAVAFSTLQAERDWPDTLVQRLRLVGQVFTNALARRRYELNLRESAARLSAGAEIAGLAYYEIDYRGGTAYVDDRFRDLCGIPPQGLPGLQPVEFWIEHLHPEDRPRVLDLREQMHAGRFDRFSEEYRFLHPTRGQQWFHHMAGVAERDEAGRVVRTYGVFRDITTRRQAEESLRASYAEIEQLKDRLQAESDYLKAEVRVAEAQGEFVGESAAIKRVLRMVEQVAPTDSTVLVLGETGTGKELVARAIHRLSPRRQQVMVKVNCAALPSGLVESELFGREKGAFTGALTRQVGRFEIADGSTLFLDEVGDLPLDAQAKLLRVLEAGEFERLGSPRTIKVDVRVIAATHRDLTQEIRSGRFREDLYFRLSVFPIRVPPLRDRVEDIPLLVWTFLGEFCSRMGKKITQVPRPTMEALCRRAWPGNIRELRNVIEHAAIIASGDTLRVPSVDGAAPVEAAPQTLADLERAHILRTLERTGGHIKGPEGAAAALGLQPSTLYSRMKKLGIRTPR